MPDDFDSAGGRGPREDPVRSDSPAPPGTVRAAGGIVTFEGVVGVVFGLVVLFRAIAGHEDTGISGYGTAAWFIILFGAVLAAGVALLTGRRGGRGVGIITQILLAPVAFSLLGQSHQIAWGIALLIVIVPAFVLLLHRRTTTWLESARGSRPARDDGADDDADGNGADDDA